MICYRELQVDLEMLHQHAHLLARLAWTRACRTTPRDFEIHWLVILKLRNYTDASRDMVEQAELCVGTVEKQVGMVGGLEVVVHRERLDRLADWLVV